MYVDHGPRAGRSPNRQEAAADNRFQSLTPTSLSRTEKSSVIKLALAVLSARYRPGRAFGSPEDIKGFLRLKLTGRRNEVFGIVFLDTRHRLIAIEELFQGTVDGAAVYPRIEGERPKAPVDARACQGNGECGCGVVSRRFPTDCTWSASPKPEKTVKVSGIPVQETARLSV